MDLEGIEKELNLDQPWDTIGGIKNRNAPIIEIGSRLDKLYYEDIKSGKLKPGNMFERLMLFRSYEESANDRWTVYHSFLRDDYFKKKVNECKKACQAK